MGILGAVDTQTVGIVSGAAQGVVDNVMAAGGAVLPIGATLLGLLLAWKFTKKFIRG